MEAVGGAFAEQSRTVDGGLVLLDGAGVRVHDGLYDLFLC
jgi:hypothetical protein